MMEGPANAQTVALYVVGLVAEEVATATGNGTKAKPATIEFRWRRSARRIGPLGTTPPPSRSGPHGS
jgi:hypothetical protein